MSTLFNSEWKNLSSYSRGRLEVLLVAIVIGLLAIVAANYYGAMAEDAKRLRLKIIASHFATGLASARVGWILKTHSQAEGLEPPYITQPLAGRDFYFSAQGWPVTMAGVVTESSLPSAEDCRLLWQGLLRDPPKLAVGFNSSVRSEFGVTNLANGCRYYGLIKSSLLSAELLYFDYHPEDGGVILGPGF